VAHDRNPAKTKVKEIMTSPIIGVDPEQTIFECAREMSEHQIHHLPVIDNNKNIVGMVSATDFLVVAEALGHEEIDQPLR
jgi:CBS domain-containing protein